MNIMQFNFQREQQRIRRENRKYVGAPSPNPNGNPNLPDRRLGSKSPMAKPNKQLPPEMPPTKIKIFHSPDMSLHYNHKVNIVIRNINAVIRLIFKNTKEQAAITAISHGNSVHQMQSYLDENRIKEI